jgi:glycosyltransferase involved in cell wall biosynthesis
MGARVTGKAIPKPMTEQSKNVCKTREEGGGMVRNGRSLSVVIPAHNASATIENCLDSIGRSGLTDVEVIVVDDGSEDVTAELAANYVGLPDVVVVRQPASGASVARNAGILRASNDLIMFVDADDTVAPGSLAAFHAHALKSGADICISDFILRSSAGDTYSANLNSSLTEFGSESRATFQWLCLARVGFDGAKNVGMLGGPWAKIYRRDFLLELSPAGELFTPGVPRGQDVLFNVEAFGRAARVSYFRDATYIYTVSDRSSSRRATSAFVSNVAILITKLQELISREGWTYLEPAIHRTSVVLLDEAVLRLGDSATRRAVKALALTDPFGASLRRARLRDASTPGKLKLMLLRAHLYGAYLLVSRYARRGVSL